MLSALGALPSLKPFVIVLSSSAVTWVKLESESEGTLFIKSWNDLEAGDILSAKFGPMFVKYLENLLATFFVLVILSPFSSTNGYVNFFFLFWPTALFKILHFWLMLVSFISIWFRKGSLLATPRRLVSCFYTLCIWEVFHSIDDKGIACIAYFSYWLT